VKQLVAFDLDGTLAESKQPLDEDMAARLAGLLKVAKVAIISGGDWPQFEKQVVSRLPAGANLSALFIMPTTGTKLYRFDGEWKAIYAEVFDDAERQKILSSVDEAVKAQGLDEAKVWGDKIEDRGSQITFSGLGQQAPLDAKEAWDPDRAKRTRLQADLRQRLPDLSINIGGSTSIDITRKGVDKAYGLRKLADHSGVALEAMLFVGDAIFPGGNDYPAKEMGLDTIRVANPDATRMVIEAATICLK
jgi:phosphomannomutase